MAATRGPIPDRSEERIRRNEGDPITKIPVSGVVEVPALGDVSFDGETDPMVVELYEALAESAQSKYYEPSDWQIARFAMRAINEELIASKQQRKPVGAMKLTALLQLLATLLMTEGDRRRVRIEVERTPDGPVGVVIDAAAQFKNWLEAP